MRGKCVSKHEAVVAYLKGAIGRREFIQRLSVAGVSTAAAVTYANALKPNPAAASGGTSAGGFLRAFQADDYGTAAETPTEAATTPVEAALQAVAEAINALIDGLSEIVDPEVLNEILETLGISGPIAEAAVENIQQAISNLQDQLATLGLIRAPRSMNGVRALQATSPDMLSVFADVFNALAGLYSNILQATDDIEEAHRIGPYAIVAGRQAAYFLTILGKPAFPDPAEPSKTPEDLQSVLSAVA